MKLKKLAKNLILKGGVIFNPISKTNKKGDIWLKNGNIEKIGDLSDLPSDKEILNCEE